MIDYVIALFLLILVIAFPELFVALVLIVVGIVMTAFAMFVQLVGAAMVVAVAMVMTPVVLLVDLFLRIKNKLIGDKACIRS